MKDEIKEILDNIKYELDNKRKFILMTDKDTEILLDYITNLQEKSNNQAEEINRLYKQREKFMKKYSYLQEEIHKKEAMYDSLAVDYRLSQEENEILKKENIKLYKKDTKIINGLKEDLKITQEKWDKDKQFSKCRTMEMLDYKSRNEKAKSLTNRTIEIIKQQPSGNDEWILERLNGINYCLGGDE